MKKGRLLTICSVAAILMLASCNKDFLDTKPLDKVSANATWSDGALSEAFVFNSMEIKLVIASYKRIYEPITPFGLFNNLESAREYCVETKNNFYGSN